MDARRVALHDRRGQPFAVLEWRVDGALVTASIRLPDRSWLAIEPRAGVEPPWGAIDRLWRDGTPLTVLTAVDWAHVTTIPTVTEPARIPAGGGTAVLNLLAALARDQGVMRLTYEGPFASEALFLALLESFRPDDGEDPLGRFVDGRLGWAPAPFTPAFDDPLYVQWRDRIEKVVWDGRPYYREDWGAVRRRAHLRVHDAADGVRCSLWALGAPIEAHLVLAPDGALRTILAPSPEPAPARPLRPAVRAGVIALVAAMSAAALGEAIRAVGAALRFTCGPVARDLARVTASEARVATTLAAAIARRLAEPAAPEVRARHALGALTEIATALGDALRARAQRRLAAATPDVQTRALEQDQPDPTAAAVIAAAVGDLLASGRVDDEPDVERDESRDGGH